MDHKAAEHIRSGRIGSIMVIASIYPKTLSVTSQTFSAANGPFKSC